MSWGGVTFVNDSMATIPAATIAALDAFGAREIVLIAGGQGKGLPLAEVGDAIAARARRTTTGSRPQSVATTPRRPLGQRNGWP